MLPIAVGGLVGWSVAGLVLLALRPALVAHGHQNWLWICLAGFALSVAGLFLMRAHDANRQAKANRGANGRRGNGTDDPPAPPARP
jgi:uncharacterized protein DUF2530